MTKIRKAVFPVGGMGTRFLPATKSMPKEMMPVVDKPLVQYAFEEAMDAGIEQFIFVTGRNKNAISNHFDHAYELQDVLSEKKKEEQLRESVGWLPEAGNIIFTRQQKPLGLGHAVWCARHWIDDEPFAVLLADDMVLADKGCLKQMVEQFANTGGNMVAVEEVPREKTNQYGVLDVEADDGRIVKARGMVEKPEPDVAPSTTSVIGRYILQPDIFTYLEHQEAGAGGEVQLTDAIMAATDKHTLSGLRFDGKRYDCGSKLGFLEANIAYAMSREDLKDRFKELMQQYCAPEQL